MVPGAAFSTGSVAPASCRTAATARGPSTIAATSGPDVMNSSRDREKRLAVMLGVVRAGQLVADNAHFQRRDGQAFALDTADDLAYQASLDPIGLDQQECPLTHGGQRTEPPTRADHSGSVRWAFLAWEEPASLPAQNLGPEINDQRPDRGKQYSDETDPRIDQEASEQYQLHGEVHPDGP